MKTVFLLLLALASALPAHAAVIPGGLVSGQFAGSGRATTHDVTLRIVEDPGPVAYFWAEQFRVDTQLDHGGYFGLQSRGEVGNGTVARLIIFSIWNAVEAQPAAGVTAVPFGGEGVGWSLRLPYAWKAKLPYAFHLAKEDAVWWRVTISVPGGTVLDMGRIRVTADASLQPGMINFTEFFTSLPSCNDLPYARAVFEKPLYGGQPMTAVAPSPYGNCAANAQGYLAGNAIVHRTGIARSREAARRTDFDGDGRADLLWRNKRTGANVIWKSANGATPQLVAKVPDLAWKVVGIADFGNDGRADILWRNSANGSNAIWRSGNAATPQAVSAVANPAWRVAATADFDGDGRADILWRNVASGANVIWRAGNSASQLPVATLDKAWNVAAAGDFDGDGRDDIVWRNKNSGETLGWATAKASTPFDVLDVTNLQWQGAGNADFDNDGRSDLFWHNAATTFNRIWKSARASDLLYVAAEQSYWGIVAMEDFGGDGGADLMLRSDRSGANVLWNTFVYYDELKHDAQPLVGVSNHDWQVVWRSE